MGTSSSGVLFAHRTACSFRVRLTRYSFNYYMAPVPFTFMSEYAAQSFACSNIPFRRSLSDSDGEASTSLQLVAPTCITECSYWCDTYGAH